MDRDLVFAAVAAERRRIADLIVHLDDDASAHLSLALFRDCPTYWYTVATSGLHSARRLILIISVSAGRWTFWQAPIRSGSSRAAACAVSRCTAPTLIGHGVLAPRSADRPHC